MFNPEFLKKKCSILLLSMAVTVWTSGCSVIAGSDAVEMPAAPFTLNYVETLIDQRSISGEPYRDLPENQTPPFFLSPAGVSADPFRVYVTDQQINSSPPSARIIIFDRGTRQAFPLSITPPAGSSQPVGRLLAPSGIAVDSAGIIYVSDSQQGLVFGYDRTGNVRMVLGRAQPLTSGTGLGVLAKPSALAMDKARNLLYVADSYAHRILVFDTIGNYLYDIGSAGRSAGSFRFPSSLTVDRSGNLYVVDGLLHQVHILSAAYELVRVFSLKDAVPGRSLDPKGIAVDSDGHVYVADALNNNILIFENNGAFILNWGRTGSLIGDFWTPSDIFIDESDYIYIADRTNKRVQVFQYGR